MRLECLGSSTMSISKLAVSVCLCVAGAEVLSRKPFPITLQHFSNASESCPERQLNSNIAEPVLPIAMLQKQFTTVAGKIGVTNDDGSYDERPAPAQTSLYVWGVNNENEHPRSLGKYGPNPRIQDYEATIPRTVGMVLNIFSKGSNGDGGLLIAMEVPSPCEDDAWVEVDRTRCSSRYPCALRLPSRAVRANDGATRFRTIVIVDDEDYLTDFIEYDRVTLDYDAEVVLTHETSEHGGLDKRTLRFPISPALASGALTVTPLMKGANADTEIFMRIRQPEPKQAAAVLEQQQGSAELAEGHEMDMQTLEATLQSYRNEWAGDWRDASGHLPGCDYSMFEIVADQVYPGEMELEVWTKGDGSLTDVKVTTRLTWSEAEVSLLDSVMKDHFNFFNDPDLLSHGLPMDALKKENPKQLTDSNPCEWGYAMESWVIMAETGFLKPEEAKEKLVETFITLAKIQSDSTQYAHGLFYPYYRLRTKEDGAKQFPARTEYAELPCGDDALLYASMMMVQGWLRKRRFNQEEKFCSDILGRMDFSQCKRETDCNAAGNGFDGQNAEDADGDKFWSVPLTFNADTMAQNSYNWNVWADEGGIVAMVVALNGAVDDQQYQSIVRQQQRYSPCSTWEGITVGHSAFFNSIFTLPTRSMLGFGTLFASPYYHEFAVRSVLPTFRAHQKLKRQLGVDYMGPSDAMSMMPKDHPGKFFGSYAYWPPNNMYDCREGKTMKENQCTWCKGIQYEGLDDPFDMIVPHGNMASFLVMGMMEKSQFSAWLEDTKLLMTDWSEVYKPGYGLEVVGPARRTPRGGRFDGAFDGRGVWESLSHGYTVLSMYEGMATMRRRFELAKQAGIQIPGGYEPPNYKPLSDFISSLPKVRTKINRLLETAWSQKSEEKKCEPSAFGPAGKY